MEEFVAKIESKNNKTQLKLNKEIQHKSATPMKLNRITKGWFKKNKK